MKEVSLGHRSQVEARQRGREMRLLDTDNLITAMITSGLFRWVNEFPSLFRSVKLGFLLLSTKDSLINKYQHNDQPASEKYTYVLLQNIVKLNSKCIEHNHHKKNNPAGSWAKSPSTASENIFTIENTPDFQLLRSICFSSVDWLASAGTNDHGKLSALSFLNRVGRHWEETLVSCENLIRGPWMESCCCCCVNFSRVDCAVIDGSSPEQADRKTPVGRGFFLPWIWMGKSEYVLCSSKQYD